MEAFSDGVIAIVITIMVLKLDIPAQPTVKALLDKAPIAIYYAMSYAYIGTYWLNHHQLISKITTVGGKLLWKNLFWLFCLSFIPFTTEFMGRYPFNPLATFVYGIVLLLSAVSYFAIQNEIVHWQGPESAIAKQIGRDIKGKVTLGMYVLAVCLAFFFPKISAVLYFISPLFWIIPDMRLKNIDEGTY